MSMHSDSVEQHVPKARLLKQEQEQSAYDRWVMSGSPGPTPTTDAAQLSRLLFDSRELVSMFRDVIRRTSGKDSEWADRVVKEIDEYRAAKGWNPHGFGGEQ